MLENVVKSDDISVCGLKLTKKDSRLEFTFRKMLDGDHRLSKFFVDQRNPICPGIVGITWYRHIYMGSILRCACSIARWAAASVQLSNVVLRKLRAVICHFRAWFEIAISTSRQKL